MSLGRPVKITAIEIKIFGEGKDNPKLIKLKQNFSLKVGNIFTTTSYENAKQELFNTANNQGYIKANLQENKILLNVKNFSARIILHLYTGRRYYFGRFSFSNSPYAPQFLHRFVAPLKGKNFF